MHKNDAFLNSVLFLVTEGTKSKVGFLWYKLSMIFPSFFDADELKLHLRSFILDQLFQNQSLIHVLLHINNSFQ